MLISLQNISRKQKIGINILVIKKSLKNTIKHKDFILIESIILIEFKFQTS